MDLSRKSALVVGAGGLGGPALLVLAGAGVGRIVVVEDDAVELARAADVVLDGSDNFATKFLANDAALRARRPLVHGGVLRTTAQLLTVVPGGLGGCLRCLFEGPPPAGSVPSCADAGVLGPVAGLAGALMGAEALRVLAGERGAYEGRLLVFEARTARSRLVLVRKRAGCAACAGTQPLEGTAPIACEQTSSRPGGVA